MGFAMWTGAFILAGAEVVRMYCRIREQKTAFLPEHRGPEQKRLRRLKARRPHVDLMETDLRRDNTRR